MLRIPHCPENRLRHGGYIVRLMHRLSFTPREKNLMVLISLRGGVNIRAMVWLIMMHLEEKCELLPLCALYLLGSYCWIRSLALEVLAYGYKISFSRGSRCVLFRNSTSWAEVINLRLEVPPHLKISQLNVCMFFLSGSSFFCSST
jgi:hypothetical protein